MQFLPGTQNLKNILIITVFFKKNKHKTIFFFTTEPQGISALKHVHYHM